MGQYPLNKRTSTRNRSGHPGPTKHLLRATEDLRAAGARPLESLIDTERLPGEKVSDFFLRYLTQDINRLEESCCELEDEALVGEVIKSVTLAERAAFIDTLKHYRRLRRIELGLDPEGGAR